MSTAKWREENVELLRKSRREWYERNKESEKVNSRARKLVVVQKNIEYVESVKAGTPCMDCGNTFPSIAMDFDHVGNDKIDSISTMCRTPVGLTKLKAEIEKCELVCSNCHRIRHADRRASLV